MNLIKIFGLFLIIFAFVGCKEESVEPSCTNYAVNFGPFYLEESTVNLFPYAKTDSILVFKNALHEELLFRLSHLIRDTTKYLTFEECPFDSTIEVPSARIDEFISASFRNDSLDLGLQLSFTARFSRNGQDITGESDLAYTSISSNFTSFHSLSSVVVYKSGLPINGTNNYHSTITLGTKTFENVYATKPSPFFPPSYILYMNYDIGIVGFEITTTGMLWVFDRTE